jgi:cytochrome P450
VFIQALSPSSPQYLLSTLQHEIKSSTTPSGALDFTALNAKPHLHSLLLEVLRFTTSSPGVRIVQADTQVGPYLLKQGGIITIHARTLQLNPQIWGNDADTFKAWRFLSPGRAAGRAEMNNQAVSEEKDKEQEKLRKLSQRAFGGGQNLCPGRHFAANEILGGFATMLGMLEIEVLTEGWAEPGVKLDDGKVGGLWPDKDVRVRIRRRREAA